MTFALVTYKWPARTPDRDAWPCSRLVFPRRCQCMCACDVSGHVRVRCTVLPAVRFLGNAGTQRLFHSNCCTIRDDACTSVSLLGRYAVNRQCSSGLQACANIAASIKMGVINAGIGAGVESMSFGGGVADMDSPPPLDYEALSENKLAKECLVPMGVTSEIVAERYGVTRAEQDALAESSHTKSLAAQAQGKFRDEIVPLTVTWTDQVGWLVGWLAGWLAS